MNLEIVKLVGIYAILVLYLLDKGRQKKWLKALPFLRHNSSESIEKKLFGFDKAINPKFFTDEAGVITNVNLAAEQFLGWKETDIIGQNINVIFPKSEHKSWHDTFLKWKGEKMETKTFLSAAMKRIGEEVPVEVVMRKEPLNECNFYLIILRDRTKEVQMIRKYEQIVEIGKKKIDILSKGEELGNTGSWVWDLEDNMLTVSDGYKRIIGADMNGPSKFDANEVRGRVLKGYEKTVEGALSRAFAGKMYDITYEQRRPSDFKIVKVRSIVKPIVNEAGIPIVFYGSTTKIDEREIAE